MSNKPLDSQPTNPYAPTSEVEFSLETGESEAHRVRRKHLKHEVSIKTMGLLYLLGAIVFVPTGLLVLVISSTQQRELGFMVAYGVAYTLLGGLQAWVGWGLRRFYPAQRIVGIVLSGLGLLARSSMPTFCGCWDPKKGVGSLPRIIHRSFERRPMSGTEHRSW